MVSRIRAMPSRRYLAVVVAVAVSCTQTPLANAPGGTVPPTASPPPLSVATQPVRTPAPTAAPTATPRRAFKIGEPIAFQDGWRLTVLKIEDQPAERFFTPKPGNRNVVVHVRHDNGSTKAISFNPFFFKLQDATGVRRDLAIFVNRDDRLGSGELAPGAFVVGTLAFEVPVADKQLQLIYEQFGYSQTTIELY